MKSTGIILLGLTTIILAGVTILSALNFEFPLIFYLTCLGQFILIISVYKILTDKYTTTKTFNDWYEDHPIKEWE